MIPAELWLVRHGESVESGRGRTLTANPELSAVGRLQAVALRRRIAALQTPVSGQTSPLIRARETAEIVLGSPQPDVTALAEFDRGSMSTVDPGTPEYAEVWRGGDWIAWPAGETRIGFRERCASYLDDWTGLALDGEITVAFTHAGVIRECVAIILESERAHVLGVMPTSITRIARTPSGLLVIAVDDVWHLEDQLAHRVQP